MSDDKLKGREALNEIGARLGDLFGAVRQAVDEASAKAAGQSQDSRAQDSQSQDHHGQDGGDADDARRNDDGVRVTFDTPKGPVTAVAGWRVRVGGLETSSADQSSADDFSSDPIKQRAKKAPDAPTTRDCRAEIFDEDDAWILTAELPGVAADELDVTIQDQKASLKTTGARRYAHTADIAEATWSRLDVAAVETRLQNGILEIRIPKRA